MSLELLVRAIKSRTPISFEHNKAGKTPGLRIGNAHAAFIMRRKDGTESTKVDIVQTAGVSDTDPPVFPEWRLFDLTEISNIGSEHEIEIKLKTLELYRRNLRSIEIVLYDESFDRAGFIVAGQAP